MLQFAGSAVEILLSFLPYFLALFLILAVLYYYEDLNFKRVIESRIKEIDALSLHKFKLFVRSLLFLLGYKEVNPEPTEEGNLTETEEENKVHEEDLLEKIRKEQEIKKEKKGKKWKAIDAVIVKEDSYVGILALKDLQNNMAPVIEKFDAAVKEYNCSGGLLIINTRLNFTDLQEANSRNIEVWDREKLIQKLFQLQSKADPKRKPLFFYAGDFWRWVLRG